MEQLRVLAQGLHDDLGHAGVEVNPGDQSVLIDDILEVAVRQKQQLLGSGIDLLGDVCLLSRVRRLWARLALSEDLDELLSAVSLLDAAHDSVALLYQVSDD